MKLLLQATILLLAVIVTPVGDLLAQAPGGVTTGLRTWYKADAIPPVSNGADIPLWEDQATADGVQNAVQNGLYLHPFFGNRQPQYRTAVARYNFNPYLDFTKQFSSLFAHKGHSDVSDYRLNYAEGATVYQVGDLTNNKGWYLGTGLGATTAPIEGINREYGYPWWGLNQQFYGQAAGYYLGTVDDYWWPTSFATPPYQYNYRRTERKTQNTIPWINSISMDKYGTNNSVYLSASDATTAMQTRVNGDRWSWGYNYTPPGPSLYIGNELTNYNAGRWWKGGIPEVFVYNRKLNTAAGDEADRVDSYLGLKYGVTLRHSYYLSDGVIAFDTACNQTYIEQIAGLVRDDASDLYQKQAQSVLKKTIVTMSLGDVVEFDNSLNTSIITDKYSLVWGSTSGGGFSRDSREVPGGFAAVPSPPGSLTANNVTWTAKKWIIQEQSAKDIGTVKVYIESKDVPALDWTTQAYIVVGSDISFSNPVYYPLTSASLTASGSDYVADINFCDGGPNASTTCGNLKTQYFAIAGKGLDIAPGGVFRNLQFWVRADMGTINDTNAAAKTEAVANVASRVREWVNVAGGVNAVHITTDEAPTLRPATRFDNFNPVVSFFNYGLNIPSGGENYDPDYSSMTAKNALGSDYTSTTGADSIAMFSLHRNLGDWYNATVGVGDYSVSPGMLHDWGIRNGIEMSDYGGVMGLSGGAANTFSAPYAGTAAVTTYNGTPGSAQDSKFGRTYSSTGFWFPQNPATIANGVGNVERTVRGNGKTIATNSSTSVAPAYNISGHRRDVGLAGGNTDLGGAAMHDGIVYTGGFDASEFEVERIETYLGIRGGITMLHNYYATDKTLLWDTTALVDAAPNAPNGYTRYNRSITGIGRDNIEALHQRVSRNAEDTTVTISVGLIPDDENNLSVDAEFENDKEYLIWGSNGGSMNARITTDLPTTGCIDSRINREYHLTLSGTNTGNYGMQVRWQLQNDLLDTMNTSTISLLIDEDGDGDYATGPIRVVPNTSYDVATNTVIFDNVQFSSSSDPDIANAAMTIGWVYQAVGEVVLFNGTATGGGNCHCPGASASVTEICTDANGWTTYKNPLSDNKVLAINWGNNVVTATVNIDASSSDSVRQKKNLNVPIGSVLYDSAAAVGARMINIALNSGTITEPVKIRFYIDSTEINNDVSWITSSGVNKPILIDSTFRWFKFNGTVADVLSTFSASGLPMGDDTSANTFIPLIPDETGTENGVNYVQFNYITSFSTIGYMQTYSGNNNLSVLPLRLLDFSAVLKGTTTNLFWTTAEEENVSHFEIERSIDGGKTFSKVGTVMASEGSGIKEYSALDEIDNYVGRIYYQLKVVDHDGQFSYSQIRVVTARSQNYPVVISPNPFNKSLTASVTSRYDQTVTLKVLAMNGQQVYLKGFKVSKGTNSLAINLAEMPSGTYIIEIIYGDGLTERQKIMKL